MRSFITFTRVCTWITLAVTGLVQILAVVGIYINNSIAEFNPILLIAATAIMLTATVLFFALPRGKVIPLLIAAADAVFFIILAFMLKNAFPVLMAVDGSDTGISLWMAIYRHMSPLLVPLFMIPSWWQYHEERQAEKTADAEERTPSYLDVIDETYSMRSLDEEDTKTPKGKHRS